MRPPARSPAAPRSRLRRGRARRTWRGPWASRADGRVGEDCEYSHPMTIERVQTAVLPDVPTAASDELWDLETLAQAHRLGDWMFEQFSGFVRGEAVEV